MSVINVDSLSKIYHTYEKDSGIKGSLKNLFLRKDIENKAVDCISFNIEEGEVVGFIGPNGSGKTTTIKMLSGLIYPSSGKAQVLGFNPYERKNEFRKQYSLIMGQKNQLWMDLPAIESFNLNKVIYQIPDREFNSTLNELVEIFDIKNVLNVQVRRLSLGERMKMELVAALLHKPKVLFLDEPTIGLDITSQRIIREFLKKYNKKFSTTILLTSHYMEDIEALCERVLIINKGHKIYDGNINNILYDFSKFKKLTVTFSEPITELQMSQFAKIDEFSPYNITFSVERDKLVAVITNLLQAFSVKDINTSEVGISEAISNVFQKAKEDNNVY